MATYKLTIQCERCALVVLTGIDVDEEAKRTMLVQNRNVEVTCPECHHKTIIPIQKAGWLRGK